MNAPGRSRQVRAGTVRGGRASGRLWLEYLPLPWVPVLVILATVLALWAIAGASAFGTSPADQRPAALRAGLPIATVKVAAGDIDSYVIRSDGTLWSWGGNRYRGARPRRHRALPGARAGRQRQRLGSRGERSFRLRQAGHQTGRHALAVGRQRAVLPGARRHTGVDACAGRQRQRLGGHRAGR